MNRRRAAAGVALACGVFLGVQVAHRWKTNAAPTSPAVRARLQHLAGTSKDSRSSQPDGAMADYVNRRLGPVITRGPNATVGVPRPLDPALYLPAQEQMRTMPRYSSASRSLAPPKSDPAAADLVLATWQNLGPANQGGRTRAFIIHPTDPNIMYAGGVAGGVWKSTDAGANWTAMSDLLMGNLAVVTLAFDPTNPNTIYAGTGEGFFNADAIRGAGIFRSLDAGGTWAQMASTNNTNFHYTMHLIVSPRNNQRIFAATRAGVFRSLDGGTSWTSLISGAAVNGCTDLAVQRTGPTGYVFAACGTFTQATVYRAADDDVSTFVSVQSLPGQGRSSIAIAPSDETVVYILAAQNSAGGGPGVDGLHSVSRSTTSGAPGSFVVRRSGTVAPANVAERINQLLLSNPVYGLLADCGFGTSQFFNQGWYDNTIAVDPLDPNRVWVGGIDLWRSDDGGTNWGTASFWWFGKGDPPYSHADQHRIVFHPQYNGTTNKVLFALSDGGVSRTSDARAAVSTTLAEICGTPSASAVSWVDRSNGYVTTQFYEGVVHPNGSSFFGGLQDNGTLRGTAGNPNWAILQGGDGGSVALDTQNDGNTNNDVLFAEFTGLSIQKSVNNGATFSSAVSGITDSFFAFIAPFTMNEGNRQQMWTGGGYLWRTTNQATTWTRASALTCGNGSVSAIAVHPADGNRVLAGMSDGYILYNTAALSATSATAWACPRPATAAVSSVAWDPANTSVAYAAVSRFGAATLYKTTDAGVSWTASVGSGATALPQVPALAVVVNPADAQQVYVGTDLGVFVSVDGGASWLLENTGFANAPVESLRFTDTAPRRLFAFTHGRGAWSVGTAATTTTTVTFEAGPHVYRGTPFTATATVTGAGLNQSLPVTYGGNCTSVTAANGCTASASFAGNANYALSNGSGSITITRATPTTTAGNRTASSGAASVLLGATITSPTAAVNEGAVTFTVRQGATPIGVPTASGTVTGGAASAAFSIPPGTAIGPYTIDVAYNPAANFLAGTAVAGTLTLTPPCQSVTVTPATLPSGALFASYAQALSASGGTPAYTFAVTAGALPAGLTLTAAGLLSGTPTASGTFNLTVTATDANGCTGAQAHALTIGLATSTTAVTFEPGPYVYRGTPFVATAMVTGAGGLSQAVPVIHSGDCTIPGAADGCTATATFAGDATYLGSSDSRSITVLQPTDAQPVTGLRVDQVAGTLVRFRWTAPRFGPAPESYILEGGVNPGDVVATLPTGSASPIFDVVVPPGSYHARVKTSASGTVSAPSNEVRVIVNLPVAPSAPISLTGVVNSSTLGLSWKNTFDGGPPTGLLLDVSGSLAASIPLGLTESFAFDGVPGGTYTLQLRAVNAGGTSPASNPVTLAFPATCTGAPAVPEQFLAYRVGAVVTVLWDPPATGAAPTSYVLDVTGSFVGTFPMTTRQISAPVTPGSYTVRVSAVNACGTSAATAAQTIVVP